MTYALTKALSCISSLVFFPICKDLMHVISFSINLNLLSGGIYLKARQTVGSVGFQVKIPNPKLPMGEDIPSNFVRLHTRLERLRI